MNPDAIIPRFVADHMLGSLARWLRMLGYDTLYDKGIDDVEIASTARSENRFILTRDKELAKEPGALFLDQDDLEGQLKAVAERFGLRYDEDKIRCSACNGELAPVSKEEASGKVPQGALENNERFWRCSRCQKLYWRGSHWKGIMERFKRLNLA
jgi:hypothetical protein